MDNFGSVVRIDRPSDFFVKMKGKFSSADRIQKLIAPARELIESTNTLKRLLEFLRRAINPRGLEVARKLKPRFLEYWQQLCSLLKARIRVTSKSLLKFQRRQFIEKENSVKPKAEPLRQEFDRNPPKGFVPLPDAEIGGCARNDSLIAPAI